MTGATPSTVPFRTVPAAWAGGLFLISGGAGLLYQVVWTRQLARVLGGSYPAVVAVVATFLLGLALGAALGGRWAPRIRSPLRTYGLLEGGIGLYCAGFPWLLALLHPVFGAAYRSLQDSPALHTMARLVLAAVLILPPTVAMGATLPVLLRGVVTGSGVLAGTGLLYGLNTLGAALGALGTGLVLLPRLGIANTVALGVAANLLVAGAALLLDRRRGVATVPVAADAVGDSATQNEGENAAPPSPAVRRAVWTATCVAGFAAMLFQMAWTRMLILSFGSSVHAFTLVVTVFILGLGLGGLVTPLLRLRRRSDLLFASAILLAVTGLGGWASVSFLADLPLRVIAFLGEGGVPWSTVLLWEGKQTAIAALLPTLAMGAAFPVLVSAAADGPRDAPRAAARVYGWNTVGTLAGALAGGMLLVPTLGTRETLLHGAMLYIGAAALLAWVALPRARAAAALLTAGGCIALVHFASTPWPLEVLHSGAPIYAPSYAARSAETGRPVERLLRDRTWDLQMHEEGRSVTVGVFRDPVGHLSLLINGKTDAGTGTDMSTQSLLGHLGALVHGAPRSAMVVGLASGVSVAAVASHGVTTLDVAEIAPEVARAEPYFRGVNGNVTERPGVRVLLEDGRTHLEHSDIAYDLIISEPTNPWIAGVSDLFTREYFEVCRSRLAPGGVLCVWVQSYGLSVEDILLVVRTVRSVFPSTEMFEMVPGSDYALVSVVEDRHDFVSEVAGRPWPGGETGAALAAAGWRDVHDFAAFRFADRAATAALVGGDDAAGEVHTDDRLQLEFRAPRGALRDPSYRRATWENLDAMRQRAPAGDDPSRAGRFAAYDQARRGYHVFLASRDAAQRRAVTAEVLVDADRMERARGQLPSDLATLARGDAPLPAGSDLWIARADAMASLGAGLTGGLTVRWAADALAELHLLRGDRALGTGHLGPARDDFLRAESLRPGEPGAALALAQWFRRAAGEDPTSPLLLEAMAHIDRALAGHPRCEAALVERAEIFFARGDVEAAENVLRETLTMRPDSISALGVYADFRRIQGKTEDARVLVNEALRYEPANKGLVALRDALGR